MQRKVSNAKDDDLVSVAEAARKTDRNRSTLHRQVKSGQIRSYSGKVRLSEVTADRAANVDTSRSRRRTGALDDVAESADATASDATNALDATATAGDPPVVVRHGEHLPYKIAREMKETALARLRQLEYDVKSGEVVSIDVVVREVTRELSVVRELLLSMPGTLANRLVGKDQHAIEAMVRDKLYEILTNLSSPDEVVEVARKAGMH